MKQTERGNQRSSMGGGGKTSRPEGRGSYGANASPSPSMSDKGTAGALKGTVGSVRKDGHGSVMSHNPYPNGIA